MAISSDFLSTAKTSIEATTEYTAYRSAVNALDAASEPDKLAKWMAAYNDAQAGMSPAYRLRAAIREVIRNKDLSALSIPEREEVYRTLTGIYLRDDAKPQTSAEEVEKITELVAAGIAS